MSLINNEKFIHIPLYYIEKKSKGGFNTIVVIDDEEAKKMLEDEEKKDELQVLNTQWAILTWADQNNIIKKAAIHKGDGITDIDIYEFRDQRIKSCLKSWDLKDDNGNSIPADGKYINMLPANIVFALIEKYDDLTSLTTDEEKN